MSHKSYLCLILVWGHAFDLQLSKLKRKRNWNSLIASRSNDLRHSQYGTYNWLRANFQGPIIWVREFRVASFNWMVFFIHSQILKWKLKLMMTQRPGRGSNPVSRKTGSYAHQRLTPVGCTISTQWLERVAGSIPCYRTWTPRWVWTSIYCLRKNAPASTKF